MVKLETVEVDSGEKDEKEVYKQRATLYRFSPDTKEWKERGRGDMRILTHSKTGKSRVVLREAKTFKVRINHNIDPAIQIKPNAGSDRSWTWTCADYSEDEPVESTFAVRFKDSTIAEAFKAKWNELAKDAASGSAASATGAADAKESEGEKIWSDIMTKHGDMTKADMDKLWAAYDKDDSKTLEVAEFKSLLSEMFKTIYKKLDIKGADIDTILADKLPLLVESGFKALDADASGNISRAEFSKLCNMRVTDKGEVQVADK